MAYECLSCACIHVHVWLLTLETCQKGETLNLLNENTKLVKIIVNNYCLQTK